MSNNQLNQAFSLLDQWVDHTQSNGYMSPDLAMKTHHLQVLPIFGMQQVRQEIFEFCQVILDQPWKDPKVLEIGLGYFGSSHFLWRQLFHKVMTIELQHDRVNRFSYNTRNFFKKHVLDDGKSLFVIGSSSDPKSVQKVYDNISDVDLLFIDGDHSYAGCLADWLLYSPLVRPGGIVAFDDSLLELSDGGVPRLLDEIRNKKFGDYPEIKNIFHSKNVGISYYIVD